MFEDIVFLWHNRELPESRKRWAVVWVKRALQSRSLLRIMATSALLRRRGAHVGRTVVLQECRFDGDLGRLSIGRDSSLNRCHVAVHDDVVIGAGVTINEGVVIMTAGHSLSDPLFRTTTAPVTVRDHAWIATNAIILPGVTIGVGAVVGAGAVVRNDVDDHHVVIGNPAQPLDTRRAASLSYSPVLFNAPYEAWVGRNLEKRLPYPAG